MQNPVDFRGTFQPFDENIQSPFLTLFMTETAERHKFCVNISINKQRQSHHGVSQVG